MDWISLVVAVIVGAAVGASIAIGKYQKGFLAGESFVTEKEVEEAVAEVTARNDTLREVTLLGVAKAMSAMVDKYIPEDKRTEAAKYFGEMLSVLSLAAALSAELEADDFEIRKLDEDTGETLWSSKAEENGNAEE